MKKKLLKKEIDYLEQTIVGLYKDLEDATKKLGIANATVDKQMWHIELLNKQLKLKDNAIQLKNEQCNALKKLYKDDLINNLI